MNLGQKLEIGSKQSEQKETYDGVTIDVQKIPDGDGIILNVTAERNLLHSPHLLDEMIQKYLQENTEILIINLENIKKIQSAALGILIKYTKHDIPKRIRLVFSKTTIDYFKTLKFEKWIPFYSSVEEAMAAVQSAK